MKRYRVEGLQECEVYQWVEAESREEAIRIALEAHNWAWETDCSRVPSHVEVGEEEEVER
tara:strand:- start:48 stop:227 length:180 start_codon:yes stop_codon:yes gene_type:complete